MGTFFRKGSYITRIVNSLAKHIFGRIEIGKDGTALASGAVPPVRNLFPFNWELFCAGVLYLAIPWSNGRRLRRGGPGLRN